MQSLLAFLTILPLVWKSNLAHSNEQKNNNQDVKIKKREIQLIKLINFALVSLLVALAWLVVANTAALLLPQTLHRPQARPQPVPTLSSVSPVVAEIGVEVVVENELCAEDQERLLQYPMTVRRLASAGDAVGILP